MGPKQFQIAGATSALVRLLRVSCASVCLRTRACVPVCLCACVPVCLTLFVCACLGVCVCVRLLAVGQNCVPKMEP